MPHLSSNRPRYYSKFLGIDWEILQNTTYLLGIISFLCGSVLFLPKYDKYKDPYEHWLFLAGSCVFLAVNIHDWFELLRHSNRALHATADGVMMTLAELRKEHWVEPTQWKIIEWTCTHIYIGGSTFYVVSAVLSLPDVLEVVSPKAGPWCLIVGSLLFMIASMLNLMFIYTTTSNLSMQLLNASAVTCFGGSLTYLLGAVMYLLDWPATAFKVEEQIAGFLFVVGSLMWFFGCIFNVIRIHSSRHFHFKEGGESHVLMKNQAYKVEMNPEPKDRLIEKGLEMSDSPKATPIEQGSMFRQSYVNSTPGMQTPPRQMSHMSQMSQHQDMAMQPPSRQMSQMSQHQDMTMQPPSRELSQLSQQPDMQPLKEERKLSTPFADLAQQVKGNVSPVPADSPESNIDADPEMQGTAV